MTIDRRQFLQLSALGIAGVLAEASCARDTIAVDHPQLLSILGADAVRDLGERYLATTPRENNADAVRAAIRRTRDGADSIPRRLD